MERQDLETAHRVLLDVALEYGLATDEASTLIEARRLCEIELRAIGWRPDDEDDDDDDE